jgi:putative ABC transport system permease protein
MWSIVGIFDSGGDSHEGEIIADCEMLQASLRRQSRYQALTVMLESPAAYTLFKEAIANNPALSVDAMREQEYFAEQSRLVSRLISTLVYVIGGIMAIGAVFGALNTMYSAVSARSVEIGTLRAIGFGSGVIIGSILFEALLLALLGGLIGAVLARALFNDYTTDTNFGSVAMELRVFSVHVTPGLIVAGLVCACTVGLVGGLFPAIRIVRMPIANALKTT